MKMEKYPSEIEVPFHDSIPFGVLSKHRFFPMSCPHDHPGYKTDLNSGKNQPFMRSWTLGLFSTWQFEASAKAVTFWSHHYTLHTKKSYLLRLVSSRSQMASMWHTHQTWVHISSVQSLSRVQLSVTPWSCQASLYITNTQSLLKLTSIESVIPSNHLIFCCPLLLLPLIFPSIRVFSSESVLHIQWPKYWNFSFRIHPSNEYSGLISFRMDWLDLLVVQRTLKSLLQHYSSKASILQHSALCPTLTSIHDHWKNHSFDWMDFCQQS